MVSGFTCGICMETLSPTKKFSSKKCSHPFCVDCISKYIASKLQDTNNIFNCPAMECNEFLRPLVCSLIFPDKLFARWCNVLHESSVHGFTGANCPFADCSEMVLNECGDGGGVVMRKTKCPSCRRMFCFKYKAGFWCDQKNVPRTAVEDVLFDRLMMRKFWRRCPRCNSVWN